MPVSEAFQYRAAKKIVFSRHVHHHLASLGADRGPDQTCLRITLEERIIDTGGPIEGFEADNSTLWKRASRERRELAFVGTDVHDTVEPPALEG